MSAPRDRRRRLATRSVAALAAALLVSWSGLSCSSPTDAKPAPVALVRLAAPASQLFVGATMQIAVTLEDAEGNTLSGRAVAWTSSSVAVATITSSGLVSGVAPGPVTLTATSEGQSGQTVLAVLAPVASVQIDTPATLLYEGGSIQLQARLRDASNTIVTGRRIDWSSSNPALIAVSQSGMATAHGLGGPVTITAMAENRSGTVQLSAVAPVASVTITPDTHNLQLGSTVQLFANARDAANRLLVGRPVTWSSANSAIASVSPLGVVTGVSSGGPIAITATVEGVSGTSQIRVLDPCTPSATIVSGQTVNGTLTVQDCRIEGFYNDLYVLSVSATTTYRIDLMSSVFDAFVILTDLTGNVIGFDDDGGGNLNSRLRIQLAPGNYIIWASTYAPGATGAYSLSLSTEACSTSQVLALGGSVSGNLSASDCRLRDGSYADRWSIRLGSAATVRFDLASEGFDPFLIVTDSSGDVIASDDDGGPGSSARVEATLPTGEYVVWANSYLAAQTGTYTLAAAAVSGSALNLGIDGVYLTQSSQRFSGSVPLVAGRAAYLRVFGRANLENTATPPVRVRLYYGGTLTDSVTIAASVTTVPTVIGERVRDRSWNVMIPASAIRPGLAISAEIDPENAIAEADETDNRLPLSGTPRPVQVRTVAPFLLTLVPVHQSATGLTGNVNAGNAETYVALTRTIYPFPSVDLVVRAPYTTTLPALMPLDENGSWDGLLSELLALRTAEGPGRNYYGVAKLPYTNGILGMAVIGAPASMGWDGADAGIISSHELGHNLGRYHAPCGGAGGPDVNYPYANGAIGVFGFDPRVFSVISRTAPDIMSYCDNPWISDYTYEAVLAFRGNASASRMSGARQSSLLVWGRLDRGKIILEPAFVLDAVPSLPTRTGPWRLVARDRSGVELFSHAFAPDETQDGSRPGAAFAFAIPLDRSLASRLHSLEVTGPPGSSRREARIATPGDGKDELRVARVAGNRMTASWDVGRYPMAMLRDVRTGQILSFVRDGQVTLPAAAAGTELELLLSDGVQTVRQGVSPR